MNLQPLNRQTATELSDPRPLRVLQFGEGNFLRAFTDWILFRMNQDTEFESDVTVVQPIEQGLIPMLNEQDGLYHVLVRGVSEGETVDQQLLIDVIRAGINPYEESGFEAFMDQAENPDLRFIISNTTEAGIAYRKEDRLEDHPPQSFPGKVTAFLYRRFQFFRADPAHGLIFLPCELINKNGAKLKEIILQLASNWDLETTFIDWINQTCTFCNTLVDRIVPGYPRDTIEEVHQQLGFADNLVTVGEQFHLWVIEGPDYVRDEFPADQAGLNVIFTDDLSPYRTRKVRILNGAHTLNVPTAYLYGLRTVKESVDDPVIGKFMQEAILEEIIPTLDLPESELIAFANAVLDRFRNPFIKHLLSSIALNSISKFKTRVLPSLLTYVERKDSLPRRMVVGLAALICFYKGTYQGEELPVKDGEDVKAFFKDVWAKSDGTESGILTLVKQVLGKVDYWEQDLNEVEGLTEMVAGYVREIEENGIGGIL